MHVTAKGVCRCGWNSLTNLLSVAEFLVSMELGQEGVSTWFQLRSSISHVYCLCKWGHTLPLDQMKHRNSPDPSICAYCVLLFQALSFFEVLLFPLCWTFWENINILWLCQNFVAVIFAHVQTCSASICSLGILFLLCIYVLIDEETEARIKWKWKWLSGV